MQFFLSSFHGGILIYNSEKSQIEVSEYESKNKNLIYSNNEIFFYNEEKNKVKLFFNSVENKFTTNNEDSDLEVIETDFFVNIKANKLFLCSTPKMEIENNRKTESLWERFQLINTENLTNIYADSFFHKDHIIFNKKNNKEIPKIIWCYWEQDNPPKTVENCFIRLKKINPEFNIIFLNKENVSKYIDISEIYDKELTPTMRSDIIRLKLLYKYGGVWSDASIIYNLSLNKIFDFKDNYTDISAFYLKSHYNKNLKNDFPVVENWLLASPPQSKTVKNWLDEVLRVLELGVSGLLNLYQQRNDYEVVKNTFSNELYFISYLAQMVSFIENKNDVSLSLYCADHSALYYHNLYGWANPDRFSEISVLKKEHLIYLPRLIKLTRTDRVLISNSRPIKSSYIYNIIN